MIPDPKRGGTFFYCPEQDKRFRTARAYRRHWRKHHGSVND